jgi:hypothetical protein
VRLSTAESITVVGTRNGSVVVERTVTGNDNGEISMPWEVGDTDSIGYIRFRVVVLWPKRQASDVPRGGRHQGSGGLAMGDVEDLLDRRDVAVWAGCSRRVWRSSCTRLPGGEKGVPLTRIIRRPFRPHTPGGAAAFEALVAIGGAALVRNALAILFRFVGTTWRIGACWRTCLPPEGIYPSAAMTLNHEVHFSRGPLRTQRQRARGSHARAAVPAGGTVRGSRPLR